MKKLFTGKLNTAFTWYVNKDGVNQCAVNSLLYLTTFREKYVKMYEEFILQLCIYTKAMSSSKRLFTNFSHIPNKITRNIKCSSNGNLQDKPRL